MKSESSQPITELDELIQRYPDIEYLDAIISDMNNHIRGKRIPIIEANKVYKSGVQIPESSFLLDYEGASSDPCGRGFSDGDPDGSLVPIPGTTAYVPWGTGKRAQVLMQLMTDEGVPSLVDPRNIAASVVSRFNELGYTANIAFELEFYLLEQKLDDNGRPRFLDKKHMMNEANEMQVYLLEDLDAHHDYLHAVHQACEIQNIPSSVVISEYSPSQYEINLRHVADPLLAADHCVLLKRVIRQVAASMGMRATFMAKPFIEYSGNGMHIHLSLLDAAGENVLRGDSDIASPVLRHAIGGLFEMTPEMFAIFAPGRNSYRRFVPDMYVPVNRTWGYNNRSVTIRIPSGDENARRLEHRIAGADANPYLVLAAVLAGVHHGITNSIDPGKASPAINVSGNVDPDLPLQWDRAVEALQMSSLAKSYLSKDYVDLYCAVKKEEFSQFRDYVTDREYQLYL